MMLWEIVADVPAKVLNCGHGLVTNLDTAGNCAQMWSQWQLQRPLKPFFVVVGIMVLYCFLNLGSGSHNCDCSAVVVIPKTSSLCLTLILWTAK